MGLVDPYCGRTPDEIDEYLEMVGEDWGYESAYDAVLQQEGTLNVETGEFACTECYVGLGQPVAPLPGWKAGMPT